MLKFSRKIIRGHPTDGRIPIPVLTCALCRWLAVVAENDWCGLCKVLLTGRIWRGGLRDRSQMPPCACRPHVLDRKGMTFSFFEATCGVGRSSALDFFKQTKNNPNPDPNPRRTKPSNREGGFNRFPREKCALVDNRRHQ